jgi:tetratricopeptide (TPR) repeat protein
MTQEKLIRGIICPLCGSVTTDKSCPDCHEDLGILHEVRYRAIQCYNLGLQLAKKKKRDAEACFITAISLDTHFIGSYIVLGKLYAKQKRYSEAIELWKKALKIDKNCKEALDCLQGLKSLFEGAETIRLESSWQGKPLRLGSEVQDTAGLRARIWRLIPNNENEALTHIVVWSNSLFKSFFPEDVMIPVELITGTDGYTVLIGGSLQDLFSRMPKYRPEGLQGRKIS